ncbi:hypothetical protein [Streptomyces sp. LN499]|uniref:hypothetical protein n=1 Tax=Streptomyces sp. LN499 TaxID=3112977 RepID=UPI0037225ED0
MNAAIGVLAALVAAQAFAFGAVRLVRPRGYEPFTWNPYGKRLLITSVAACFGVGLPAVWIGIPWWTVPAVGVPAVVCAAGLMHHRLRPRAAGGVGRPWKRVSACMARRTVVAQVTGRSNPTPTAAVQRMRRPEEVSLGEGHPFRVHLVSP